MQSLDKPNERLGYVLSQLNLSRTDVAEKTGVDYGTVCRYITGGLKFGLKFAKLMEDHYNISSFWLIDGKGEMFIPEQELQNNNSKIKQLIEKVDGLEKTVEEQNGMIKSMYDMIKSMYDIIKPKDQ